MLIGNIIIVSYVERITETWNQSWQLAVKLLMVGTIVYSLPIVIFPIFLLDLLIIIPVIAIVSIGVNDIDCNILLLQIPTD